MAMDFSEQVKQLGERVKTLYPSLQTEEATKQSLILPFFHMLGYDIFNPLEFVPEFTADVGIKKGEKVDYAIMRDNAPVILIEAKHCAENLNNHSGQLFRYFGTTSAKVGILTNGLIYRFYTDLDAPNRMDTTPFMEFNMLDIKDNLIPELRKFHRDYFDLESVFNVASDLKYTTLIKAYLQEQSTNPSEEFVKHIMSAVYEGKRTAANIEKFTPIVKKSFSQYLNDVMNERLKKVTDTTPEEKEEEVLPEETVEEKPKIITTDEEVEIYITIKALLHSKIDVSRITYKDTQSYFGILLDGKTTKWICRLYLDGKNKYIRFHSKTNDSEDWKQLDATHSIYDYQHELEEALNNQM